MDTDFDKCDRDIVVESLIKSDTLGPLASSVSELKTSTMLKEHGEYTFPANGGFIEITLHPPNTHAFLQMSSEKQKLYLARLWSEMLTGLDPMSISDKKFITEFTQAGVIHIHGYIKLVDQKYYPVGCVSDLVKAYLNVLPRGSKYSRYRDFNPSSFSKQYCRYECASCCITYRYSDDTDSQTRWYKYMSKAQ